MKKNENDKTIKLKMDHLLKEFHSLSSWEERYRKIISIGKALSAMPASYKEPKWEVEGCQAKVWLYASMKPTGEMCFQADSDALITKGLVGLLVKLYSGLKPKEVLTLPVDVFFDSLDLQNHLSPTRVGGMLSVVKQIQYYAKAYQLLDQNKGPVTP